nr:hypothetical protein [Tanacetum cinerariifolium]
MLTHTLNKMLSSMFRHEQSEDIGSLMLQAIGKCAIMSFLPSSKVSVTFFRKGILRNYEAEAEAKEEVVPKPPPRVVCAWIRDDLCRDGDLPAWSSITCSVQSDYRVVFSTGECNIGEGEWNGVVCRHTDTSVAVFGEQGSASSMGHRVKREEAKITGWENLQKPRAEANSKT